MKSPNLKPALAHLLPVLLLFTVGCLTPRPDDYKKIVFEKVYSPGTEKLAATETAVIQIVSPEFKRPPQPIVVYSVDGRPVLCKIANGTGRLIETRFATTSDSSILVNRPTSMFIDGFFHLLPHDNFPLPMRQAPWAHRQLVLTPGDHQLELGLHNLSAQAFESIGTAIKTVKCEPGKTYVIEAEQIPGERPGFFQTAQFKFRYTIKELNQ